MASAAPLQLRFEVEDKAAVRAAGGYDCFIRATGCVPSRENNWHDLLNALVWTHLPGLKLAIHQQQLADVATRDSANRRGPVGDVATLFDERGVVLLSSDESLLELVRRLRWRELFWQRRTELVARARFLVVGHALLHALLTPYVGLTANAWLVVAPAESARDWRTAREYANHTLPIALEHQLTHPRALHPLPILGVPGFADNDQAEYYDGQPRYFRTRRRA